MCIQQKIINIYFFILYACLQCIFIYYVIYLLPVALQQLYDKCCPGHVCSVCVLPTYIYVYTIHIVYNNICEIESSFICIAIYLRLLSVCCISIAIFTRIVLRQDERLEHKVNIYVRITIAKHRQCNAQRTAAFTSNSGVG